MRRTILTIVVTLFSVAAPVSTATASAHAKAHHRAVGHVNARALAIDNFHDHREMLQRGAERALVVASARFHVSLAQLVEKWQRVAICEVNGNWSMVGPYYSGIGFSNDTWNHFGGREFAPYAGMATRMEQIFVAMKITQTYVPDQYGCSPHGW